MYEPKVNDYVQWENGKGVEGWVYFKDAMYLTIEANVYPKHPDDLPHGTKRIVTGKQIGRAHV